MCGGCARGKGWWSHAVLSRLCQSATGDARVVRTKRRSACAGQGTHYYKLVLVGSATRRRALVAVGVYDLGVRCARGVACAIVGIPESKVV